MSEPLLLEWARRGEVIQAPSIGETREPYMVLSSCGGDLFHLLYCENCNVNLANIAQLEMHIEQGGHHRIATWCGKRRVYEMVDPIPTTLQVGAVV